MAKHTLDGPNDVVSRLKTLLDREKLSRPKLAELTGIEAERWASVINRKIHVRFDEIMKVCDLFPMHKEWLLFGEADELTDKDWLLFGESEVPKAEPNSMDDIVSRLAYLLKREKISRPKLGEMTGIDTGRWGSVLKRRVYPRVDEILEVCRLWPMYRDWLIFGETFSEKKQLNPAEVETLHESKMVCEGCQGVEFTIYVKDAFLAAQCSSCKIMKVIKPTEPRFVIS